MHYVQIGLVTFIIVAMPFHNTEYIMNKTSWPSLMGLQGHSKTCINVRLHSNSNTNSISTHRAKTWIEQTILTRTE